MTGDSCSSACAGGGPRSTAKPDTRAGWLRRLENCAAVGAIRWGSDLCSKSKIPVSIAAKPCPAGLSALCSTQLGVLIYQENDAASDRQIPAVIRDCRNDCSGRAAGYGYAGTCLLPAAGRASLSRNGCCESAGTRCPRHRVLPWRLLSHGHNRPVGTPTTPNQRDLFGAFARCFTRYARLCCLCAVPDIAFYPRSSASLHCLIRSKRTAS